MLKLHYMLKWRDFAGVIKVTNQCNLELVKRRVSPGGPDPIRWGAQDCPELRAFPAGFEESPAVSSAAACKWIVNNNVSSERTPSSHDLPTPTSTPTSSPTFYLQIICARGGAETRISVFPENRHLVCPSVCFPALCPEMGPLQELSTF